MSYYMLNGFQGADGLMGYGTARLRAVEGLGAAATVFDPNQVYSDWLQQTTPAANAAVKQIQQGLNTLNYGPLVVDGVWGSGSSRAFLKFSQDAGTSTISSCPGSKPGTTPVLPGSCPTKDGIAAMAAKLSSGGSAKAGMLTAGIGVVAVVALGLLAMSAKKKHPESHQTRTQAV